MPYRITRQTSEADQSPQIGPTPLDVVLIFLTFALLGSAVLVGLTG